MIQIFLVSLHIQDPTANPESKIGSWNTFKGTDINHLTKSVTASSAHTDFGLGFATNGMVKDIFATEHDSWAWCCILIPVSSRYDDINPVHASEPG